MLWKRGIPNLFIVSKRDFVVDKSLERMQVINKLLPFLLLLTFFIFFLSNDPLPVSLDLFWSNGNMIRGQYHGGVKTLVAWFVVDF